MFKGIFVFAGIAAVAAVGVDYFDQTMRAELALGQLGPTDYVGTISHRIDGYRQGAASASERKQLMALPPRDFLPEAPPGWTRRDWTAEERSVLDKSASPGISEIPEAVADDGKYKAMMSLNAKGVASRDAQQVWLYTKPGAMVALRVSISAPKHSSGGGMQGEAMRMIAANIAMMSHDEAFAVVQGVPYLKSKGGLMGVSNDIATGIPDPVRKLKASLGDQVTISVLSIAQDEDLIELLNSLDYDRMNKVLLEPIPGIGSDAPVLTAAQQRIAAQRADETADRGKIIRALAAEVAMQERALKISAIAKGEGDPAYIKHYAHVAGMRKRLEDLKATDAAARAEPLPDAEEPLADTSQKSEAQPGNQKDGVVSDWVIQGIGLDGEGNSMVIRNLGDGDATITASKDGVKINRNEKKSAARKPVGVGGSCRVENGRKICSIGD